MHVRHSSGIVFGFCWCCVWWVHVFLLVWVCCGGLCCFVRVFRVFGCSVCCCVCCGSGCVFFACLFLRSLASAQMNAIDAAAPT